MSRVAWFNCAAGTAGDMTLAALIDAGADSFAVGAILGGLKIDDYALTFERTQRSGVSATRAIVTVHDHQNEDQHHHRSWKNISQLLQDSELPDRVRTRALTVFHVLAEVEAKIHNVSIDDIEFHEVGSVDAIIDIVGVCAALEVLNLEKIYCGDIAVGHGHINTAHGVLPNPAPAVAALCALRNVTMVGLDDHRELATPTGVAVMIALAESFGVMPAMGVRAVGYGAGSADVSGRANVVQVIIGDATETSVLSGTGQIVQLLEANVDDVTGEVVAHTIASLLSTGAHDAWASPIVMKKGRPAFTIHALCDPSLIEKIAAVLVRETGTLGLRGTTLQRWPQTRTEKTVTIDGYDIRVKISGDRVKVEYDDALLAATALDIPLREVLLRAEQSAQ